MILADTSVWIDHLRAPEKAVDALFKYGALLMHPFVLGELAMGNLRHRKRWLRKLQNMPQANIASLSLVQDFIESHALYGSGIGYIDAHLLAATSLLPGTLLWTRDKRLHAIGQRLQLAADIPRSEARR
ncbi:type II toxin-antitoxin system VapC family toxin [Massilia sp. BJB1822]|uniref:type II toxin-antitoxin system VapC family toxin n=1 Tax=Massilia sp. BJB1822 TaxID=2744470 RepID=UPI001593A297|nr:type II toxin-antitoxin system VapC family toxin [Massilia sp. BJB1822]NVD99517.1 type II toxin-antitoxin system VapC family toxin [Massilia sp. BJB1822]